MALRPLANHIFFTPMRLSSALIAIPDNARTAGTNRGVVTHIGQGCDSELRVGDEIIYDRLKAGPLPGYDIVWKVHNDNLIALIR